MSDTPSKPFDLADYVVSELDRLEHVIHRTRETVEQLSAVVIESVNDLNGRVRVYDQRLEQEAGRLTELTTVANGLDAGLRAELAEVRSAAVASIEALEGLTADHTVTETRRVVRDANGSISHVLTTTPEATA